MAGASSSSEASGGDSSFFPRLKSSPSTQTAGTSRYSGGSLYPTLDDMPTSVRSFSVEDEPSLLFQGEHTPTPRQKASYTPPSPLEPTQQQNSTVSSPFPNAPVHGHRERKYSHDPPGTKEDPPSSSQFNYPPQPLAAVKAATKQQQQQQQQRPHKADSQPARSAPFRMPTPLTEKTTATTMSSSSKPTVNHNNNQATTLLASKTSGGSSGASTFFAGTPSRKGVSLEDDDPNAISTYDAHQKKVAAAAQSGGVGAPAAAATTTTTTATTTATSNKPSLLDDDDNDTDDPENADEAKDQVPPIMFQPHMSMRRQVSLKKPPPGSKTNHGTPAMPPVKQPAADSPDSLNNSANAPVPQVILGGPLLSSPHRQRPSLASAMSGLSTTSDLTISVASLDVGPMEHVSSMADRDTVEAKPSSPAKPATATQSSASEPTETEEEKQLRLAKEASLLDAQKLRDSTGGTSGGGGSASSSSAAKEESVPDDMLETARENSRTLQSICRQGQEGTVDPSILEYYLSMCTQDQERISSSSVGNMDIDKVEKVLAVNDMLLTAIEVGQEYKKQFQKKPASSKKNDSLAIASLVAKKDIFSLICMLRAQDENQRLEAALALMHFARKAELDDANEEDRRLRNEIISSGGLHSLLTLYRSRSSMFELKTVVALAIAYLMSSSSLLKPGLKPGLGIKIMECLRFLSQGRDVSPRGERIAKEESFQAAAIGLTNFWVNQLEPLLRSQGGELPALLQRPTAGADHLGRLSRRGRTAPGHVFDQRKEAIGTQELLEMTVSLIIEFASQTSAATSRVASDPVLLVEQICAVEVARPIAVREGVLKILVGWIERDGNGRNRLAAAHSLLNLTRIKDKYMAGWIHSQMVNEGALPAIVRLTRDESLGPQARLAIAKILSSLCVAPHTRAAVVEAECIHFLVDILFEHVTSEEVALFASQALMQLAAGAITRASALGADGVQSNAFVSPDKRDKVIE